MVSKWGQSISVQAQIRGYIFYKSNQFYEKCIQKVNNYGVIKKPANTFKIRNFSCNELKIGIYQNSRMGNSNSKSDFEYFNCKCLKAAIGKSKNGKKPIRPNS